MTNINIRLRQIADHIKTKRLEMHKLQRDIKGLKLYGSMLRLGISDKDCVKLLNALSKQAAAEAVDKE